LNFEVNFTLPIGYQDENGALHRDGVMRLARTIDEIEPLKNKEIRENPAFFNIILISRVLVSLGQISPVSVAVVQRLFAADFVFLQDVYLELNTGQGKLRANEEIVETECPSCQHRFLINVGLSNIE
jgi:hypothetical protein